VISLEADRTPAADSVTEDAAGSREPRRAPHPFTPRSAEGRPDSAPVEKGEGLAIAPPCPTHKRHY